MPATRRPVLHHVNLKTTRLDEMIQWYGQVVGCEVVFRFEGGAWLTNDAANHRLALLTSSALTDDGAKLEHAGLHHIAFEYESLDDLLDEYSRLAELGLRPHFTVDHGMTTSFYYVDPDGNSVELQVDNFADWRESTAFMSEAEAFALDPVGPLVDPELMLAMRAEGASAAEIHRLAYAGDLAPEAPMDPRVPLDAGPVPRTSNQGAMT